LSGTATIGEGGNLRSADYWQSAILPATATVQQVIWNLDRFGMRIVLIANETGELLGTVSDGDVRRGLLAGLDMSSPAAEIMHRSPLVVPPDLGRETVLHLMVVNKIQQIPVVDDRRKIVGLHLWDEVTEPPKRPNTMVIMAGGRGTRLHPYTENCPKPLLPVAGKPMLEHIIDRARQEGFGHFILAVHYLGHMIEDYFGDGSGWGVMIEYLREETPLGTAGALNLLSPRPTAPIIVSNGDVLTDIRYGELLDFHTRHSASASMAVRMHEWRHPYGVVQIEGVDILGFEEKPIARTHINAGVYALSPAVLDLLPGDTACDMPSLFERAQARHMRTIAYPMHEPWLDVGRPEDLRSVNDEPAPASGKVLPDD
jgi:dTDP-glucose pyrophosphorylase